MTLSRQQRRSTVARPPGLRLPSLTPYVLPFTPSPLPQAEIFETFDGSFAELA